jgi:hypothetical protein
MNVMDERIVKQIQAALTEAQKNYEQALANVNYWKGREDALMALLEPVTPETLPPIEGK